LYLSTAVKFSGINNYCGFEPKQGSKLNPDNRESQVTCYVSRLFKRTVTFGCVQSKALMVSENVQGNLNRERAYFGEDNNIPLREMS